MNKANIVVMGKTGVGKSTLINAVLGEKKAKTGQGLAQTLENERYSTVRNMSSGTFEVNLLDTVGLELDSKLNARTIQAVKQRIDKLSQKYMKDHADINDVHMVWYCIQADSGRFEQFEEDFVRETMNRYEIPFMIVLTQCYSKRKSAAMKSKICESFPSMPIETVLAEADENLGIGAFGVKELLKKTVTRFNEYKLNILQDKLELVGYDKKLKEKEDYINRCEKKARKIIKDRAEAARKMGWIPGASVAALPTQYTAMIREITLAFGLTLTKDAHKEITAAWIASLVTAPFTIFPGLASAIAESVIEESGQEYLDSILSVVRESSQSELADSKLISDRLIKEINRRKKNK